MPVWHPQKEDAMNILECQEVDYTIEDLFDLVFPADMEVNGYLSMIYNCFLDDSKDKNQTKLMVSAGFFGTKDDWGDLRARWSGVLKRHGLDYFKSSEYYSLTGQFKEFRTNKYPPPTGREAAERIRSELQAKLEQCPNIHGIGVMVLLEDYYRVLARPEAQGILPSEPYHTALDSVIYETVKMIKLQPGRNLVAFVHDDGPDFDSLRVSYQKFKEKNPITAKKLGGFVPMDDKVHPPLQAADMVSNYSMHLGLEAIAKGGTALKAACKEMKANMGKLAYWDENYILGYLKSHLVKRGEPIPIDFENISYD